ncbi:MAG TPA: YbiU family protein, partial [Kineosporiaceae bacterium]|nr:YbiU family protein [Kineosporiaceae bacterium]
PDRIRRRPPGADSGGLGTHLDPGTLDLWMTQAYQRAFRHLFDGTVEQYDPWDAAHRTAGPQYPGSTMCSAFRTFQGWTALSDMDHDQGVLHTVPIPEAMAYLMLRPLLPDVPDDDMCGVTTNRVFPASERWHAPLLEALSGIPDVRAGDSVWWHCDMIHSVAPVQDQQGWGNVMYIPAAPWCPRNEIYAASVREAFLTGSSPSDFPAEDYERDWPNRFTADRLNETGRRGLGLA